MFVVPISSSAAEVRTIQYVTWLNEQVQGMERELIAEFERQNPDIKVEYQWFSSGEYQDKLETLFVAGLAPDIATMSWFQNIPGIVRGLYVDLLPYIARGGLDVNDFFPVMLDHWRYEGGLYAMPMHGDTVALFYNQSLFEEAGLVDPNVLYDSSSWDWEAMLDVAKRLTQDPNGDGAPDQWGMSSLCWACPERGFALFPALNGVDLHNADRSATNMNHPHAVEAYQFFSDLINVHRVTGSSGLDFPTGNQGMVADAGTWRLPVYSEAIGTSFDWDVVPWAQGPHGGKYSSTASMIGMAISEQSEHKEEAWRFIRFMMSKGAMERRMELGTSIPSLRVATQIPGPLRDGPPEHAYRFLEITERAHEPWVTGLADPVAIQQLITNGLRPLMSGSTPATSTLSTLAEQVNRELQEQREAR